MLLILKIYLGYLIFIEFLNLVINIIVGQKETIMDYVQTLDEWYYTQFGMHLKYNLNSQCIQRICKIIIICTLIMLL
jgi:hypothetical protein